MKFEKQQAVLALFNEGVYDVSENGVVISYYSKGNTKRKEPLVRAHGYHKRGYPRLDLYYKTKIYYASVHQLVWLKYRGPIPPGQEINHVDANTANCSLSNLELVSRSENAKHAFMMKRRVSPGGRLNEKDVGQIWELKSCMAAWEIAAIFDVDVSSIYNIFSGRTWVAMTAYKN